MKRLIGIVLALLLVAPVSAQSPQIRQLLLQQMPVVAGGGTAFSGPVDAVASPTACWSLRACSAALRGNALANVCDTTGGTDVACADILSDATTGNAVAMTIGGVTCPGSANCKIKTWYDQTGSNCAGPCDVIQATIASRPTLTANCNSGSLPCATFAGAQKLTSVRVSGSTTAQPLTISAVMTTTITTENGWVASQSGWELIANDTGANQASIYGNGSAAQDATATNNVRHSLQAVANSTSSLVNVDGIDSSSGTSIGTIGWTSNTSLFMGSGAFSDFAIGTLVEVLVYPVGFTSGSQSAAMCHNQRLYWGSTGSC